MADDGTYIKMSDRLPEHRKIAAAGGDAGWLYVCGLGYASRNLSDGHIPKALVPRLSDRKQPAKLVAKLLAVDLWHEAGHECKRCPQPLPDEYVIHDYLEHQRSSEKISEIKAKRAAAGKRGGSRKASNAKQTPSNLLGASYAGAQANGTPDTEEVLRTSQTEEPLRGSQSDTRLPPPADADAPVETSQTILAEYIDWCRKRPPKQVIGQLGKLIAGMLDEGIAAGDIKRGMAAWHDKGKNPSTLPSFVNEVMNGGNRGAVNASARRVSTTDQRVGDAVALAQRLAEEDRAS